MKKLLLLTAACATVLPLAAFAEKTSKMPKSAWTCYIPPNPGGIFQVEEKSPDGFKMNFQRTDPKVRNAWATAVVNINREMWSQNKLVFSIHGHSDKPFRVNPQISYAQGKKAQLVSAPAIHVRGTAWRDVVVNLDSDFRLGDAGYHVLQLKFCVNISHWKEGEKGGVELKNIKLCTPSEVSLSGASSGDFMVVPLPEKTVLPQEKNPLKIYFCLDNEDHEKIINHRKPDVVDSPQFGGFREMLLLETKGKAVETPDLKEADLIVYASCRPAGKRKSAKIAEAVRSGTPLYVASEVADPEIAELLPCTVSTPVSTGFPVRETLSFSDPNHPIAKNGGLNKAAFGIYHNVAARANGRTVLAFSNGMPALVEGFAGKGKVIYNALSFGAGVIPGKTSFDAFFIRIAAYLGKRDLPETARKKIISDRDGWFEGAGKNNFGRFGWEIGDGLLVGSIGSRLAVSSGVSEYEFSSDSKEKNAISRWIFTGLDGKSKEVNFRYSWNDIGVVKLEAKATVPAAWKGKNIFFFVEKGIDDTADVFFNGEKIGGVTKETPQYWMTPHRYRIPERLIRFDAENSVVVRTENLRGTGSFGSCPEISVEQPAKKMELTIDRINHTGKGGFVMVDRKKVYRFDTSLAFPGVRWEFFTPSVVISLYNVANYAAYSTPEGIKTVDLRKADSIPADWNAPWLFLFSGTETDNPLLLVFQHRLNSLKVVRNGETVGGLELKTSGKTVGTVVPVWINGSAPADARGWNTSLPESLLKRIAFWYPRAFRFPDNCREEFRIDRNRKRVEIRGSFSYLNTKDDWNTASRDYAPVPALAYFTKGTLFESDQAERRELPTNFGYFADRDGSNSVTWRLPLPEPDLGLLPHVKGFPELEKLADFHFSRGVLFSAGGGTKYESRNNLYPMGKGMPDVKNCNMHSSLMGISQTTENPFIYSPENWKKMVQRYAVRLFEPLERCQYKMVSCWREEPFSGIRYTNYMRSARDISTKFAPGYGTKIIYGDSNETVQMILTACQRAADRFGQRDLVLANWEVIRDHVASFALVQDDWGYLSSGCLDSGGPASIDMLNCEYSSMMKLARLAEIAGDGAMRDQALYRGARRMVPTLARLGFKKYSAENRMLSNPETAAVSTGFTESGAIYRSKGAKAVDVEFFDMSQGIPRDLLRLYRRFGFRELRSDYLNDILRMNPRDLDYNLIAILAIAGELSDAELMNRLNAVAANTSFQKRKCGDWPAMCTGSYLAYTLHRLRGNPVIQSVKDMYLSEAVFDPTEKKLSLTFDAGKNAELTVFSSWKLIPGNQFRQESDGTVRIDVSKPGKQKVVLTFR